MIGLTESSQDATARGGRNTGYQDAVGVLARVLQRGRLGRAEVEEVIAGNCRREGRSVPSGSSMERRVERLRATLERSGLVLGAGPMTELGRIPTVRAPAGMGPVTELAPIGAARSPGGAVPRWRS